MTTRGSVRDVASEEIGLVACHGVGFRHSGVEVLDQGDGGDALIDLLDLGSGRRH